MQPQTVLNQLPHISSFWFFDHHIYFLRNLSWGHIVVSHRELWGNQNSLSWVCLNSNPLQSFLGNHLSMGQNYFFGFKVLNICGRKKPKTIGHGST